MFCLHVPDLDPAEDDVWDQVIARAPDASVPLDAAEVDRVLEAMGDFVDLKSPWIIGHSRAVAELAVRAGGSLGLGEPELTDLARAGRVMDLGLMGVPNRVWRKTTVLSPAEEERVRLHPYLTRRILSRVGARATEPPRVLSSRAARRLGISAGDHCAAARPARADPGAAEEYRSLRESHPLRPALAPGDAARSLRGDVRAGRLDGPAVEAVLAAAGNRPAGRPAWPAGLTGREVTVLRGIARGQTAAAVGADLHISPKTARNHIEHIYVKIGASNRTAAALFALSHGLLGDPE
jgi:DNA-binding CsgD family transcriptional regulator